MPSQQKTIRCYNQTATKYADKFFHELDHKHMDRILLQAFAAENKGKGKMIDIGCGPGQTTVFLSGMGIRDLVGTDLSTAMIDEARKLSPGLAFETADMLQFGYADNSFGSAVAFYAVVHFDEAQLLAALKEINRVLIPKGQFLFSFHTGNEEVHLDEFLGEKISIDFQFFETNKVIELAKEAGFSVVDVIERMPYAEEHPTVRAYIWVEKG
jgi:SAM-dependent methyltransferase